MGNGAESYSRFLDGDRDALTEIIREHRDGMIFFANSIVNDFGLAEEVVQEVFIKLIVKKPKYSQKSTFKTWLYSICRNTAVDFIRKSVRKSELYADELSNLSDEKDLEEQYIKEEQRITIRRVMSVLNSDYCQVLYLTFFEGFDNSDTARVMKKSNRQIENLVYRAKKALKSELEREGFVYEKL